MAVHMAPASASKPRPHPQHCSPSAAQLGLALSTPSTPAIPSPSCFLHRTSLALGQHLRRLEARPLPALALRVPNHHLPQPRRITTQVQKYRTAKPHPRSVLCYYNCRYTSTSSSSPLFLSSHLALPAIAFANTSSCGTGSIHSTPVRRPTTNVRSGFQTHNHNSLQPTEL